MKGYSFTTATISLPFFPESQAVSAACTSRSGVEKAELAVLVESTYRLICRMSRAGICGVHLAARSSRRALPSRFYHHPPAARKNFWEKCETDATFWTFRGSIYIRGCDRDVWPFRRVRRAAPAALGGGTAATGLRAIWGARTPAAEGCCAYDCPQMKKSLQSQTVQRFCR